ncbi:MAG: extradiol ring-cleavage dioxygenase [Beijerinckiaceae bacterium]|nr:extradiol ring-cleavage dioxygenase [Beijerinckiaceae bacterium]
MARMVAAFAASHSVMLTCTLEDWQRNFRTFDPKGAFYDRKGNPVTYEQLLAMAPPNAAELVSDAAIAKRFDEVQRAMQHMRAAVRAAQLDVLIICGDDQNELFSANLQPALGIYHGKTIRNAQRTDVPADAWYKRAQMKRLEEHGPVDYPVADDMALHFIQGLVDRNFDVAALAGMPPEKHEGHAFSFMHRIFLDGAVMPIVPVFLNTYFPPNQPTPKRCVDLGRAIGALVSSFPGDARVGFMASGGLSHFQAEEDLDGAVIDAMRRKDLAYLETMDVKRLQAGSSEIRNWLVLAGACPDLDLTWVSYTPGYRTEALTGTGLGFATWYPPKAVQ